MTSPLNSQDGASADHGGIGNDADKLSLRESLSETLAKLASQPDPGPAPKRARSTAQFTIPELSCFVAIGVLIRAERSPLSEGISIAELVSFTDLVSRYRRFNSVGDAISVKGCGMERDRRGRVLLSAANRVRAARYLSGKVATASVAAAVPGLAEGDDLTAFAVRLGADRMAAQKK